MFSVTSAFSDALHPTAAAEGLAAAVETDLPSGVAGGLVLTTAASGPAGFEIGRLLADRWPAAQLGGTAFEGLLAGGRVHRDRPATLVIAWAGTEGGPAPFLLEPEVFGAGGRKALLDEAAHLLELTRGGAGFAPEDLVLLFPDAIAGEAVEPGLAELGRRLGEPVFLGAAASGGPYAGAPTWLDEAQVEGATLGLVVPGGSGRSHARVGAAGATRFASPWLEIGDCRARWVDELDGEPALEWVRRQLGLERGDSVEPYLDRLMVRLRPTPKEPGAEQEVDEQDLDYVERFVVGIDERRGSISVPGAFGRGGQLALALPDSARARASIREAVGRLAVAPLVLQFACRARDESLHGDADLEAALVQQAVGGREAAGAVAPFQIGPAPSGASRQLVFATVFAALGSG